MISPSELRLGNLVNTPRADQNPFRCDRLEYMTKNFVQVGMWPEGQEWGHPLTWDNGYITPIPITMLVLQQCGFTTDERDMRQTYWKHPDIKMIIVYKNDKFYIDDWRYVESLHWLQNFIYYTFGRYELTFKPIPQT